MFPEPRKKKIKLEKIIKKLYSFYTKCFLYINVLSNKMECALNEILYYVYVVDLSG